MIINIKISYILSPILIHKNELHIYFYAIRSRTIVNSNSIKTNQTKKIKVKINNYIFIISIHRYELHIFFFFLP